MTEFAFNAQDVCATRLCAGARCPDDASTGSALCERCSKRARMGKLELHVVPVELEPTLPCTACKKWLPDKRFVMRTPHDPGYSPKRRGRRTICNGCAARIKREWRADNSARKAAAKALVKGQVQPQGAVEASGTRGFTLGSSGRASEGPAQRPTSDKDVTE